MENEMNYFEMKYFGLKEVLETLENAMASQVRIEAIDHLEFAKECVLEHYKRINEGR